MSRIGFACKYIAPNGAIPLQFQLRTTTAKWLKEQSLKNIDINLQQLVSNNLTSTYNLIDHISLKPTKYKMLRLSSNLLPLYTHPDFSDWYQQPIIQDMLQSNFRIIGRHAKAYDVRLSFHPGQFCVLASHKPEVVERSIAEFEYHADMASWMGYGQTPQSYGFKINIHLSGRAGAPQFKKSLGKLSPIARNLITVENDEVQSGIEDVLTLSKLVPIVMDIHHHWVKTGEYIDPAELIVDQVIESWRGVRPVMHYSVSKLELFKNPDPDTLPDLAALLAQGTKRRDLRAHSDMFWNNACNDWALSFLDNFDIMCESKSKNQAANHLISHVRTTN